MRALRTTTLLIALAGARIASADPAPAEAPMSASDTAKLVVFFDQLVATSTQNANDCRALAGAVDGLVTQHKGTLDLMWAARKAKQVLPKDVQAHLDQRASELVSALKKCWDDDGVKAAFRRMKPPKDKQ